MLGEPLPVSDLVAAQVSKRLQLVDYTFMLSIPRQTQANRKVAKALEQMA